MANARGFSCLDYLGWPVWYRARRSCIPHDNVGPLIAGQLTDNKYFILAVRVGFEPSSRIRHRYGRRGALPMTRIRGSTRRVAAARSETYVPWRPSDPIPALTLAEAIFRGPNLNRKAMDHSPT
jgi:hypothetical protein